MPILIIQLAKTDLLRSIPALLIIASCLCSGSPSTYLPVAMWAIKLGEAILPGIGYLGIGAVLKLPSQDEQTNFLRTCLMTFIFAGITANVSLTLSPISFMHEPQLQFLSSPVSSYKVVSRSRLSGRGLLPFFFLLCPLISLVLSSTCFKNDTACSASLNNKGWPSYFSYDEENLVRKNSSIIAFKQAICLSRSPTFRPAQRLFFG